MMISSLDKGMEGRVRAAGCARGGLIPWDDELELEAKRDDLDAEFGRRDEEDRDYH